MVILMVLEVALFLAIVLMRVDEVVSRKLGAVCLWVLGVVTLVPCDDDIRSLYSGGQIRGTSLLLVCW